MNIFLKCSLFILLPIIGIKFSLAQELNCNVQINSTQVIGSDKSIFDAMQKNIYEFMNNKKWTNNVFQNNERIECTILINITEQVSTNHFKGTLQVQSRRPVYNTSYNTTLLNHLDKDLEFDFNEFDNLEYSETTFISNLTSVLAYYAYIILAYDYDSFSLKGGDPYLEKALVIVNNAQSAKEAGWKAFENTSNRYWLVQDLLRPNYEPLRICWYQYHRLGFDTMAKNVDAARAQILQSLNLLEKIYNVKPGAKVDEIVNLFSEADTKEKSEVSNLLNKIDPTDADKFEKIIKGK